MYSIQEEVSKRVDSAIVLLLALVAALLLLNINYFEVPETDFFEFFKDGQSYLQFKLPELLYGPPAYPIIISLLGMISNTQDAVRNSAIVINILAFATSTYLLWRITKRQLGAFALLLIALVLTNPLSYYSSLQPINGMFFTLSMLTVLYLRQKEQYKAAYLVAGFSFLIRYEATAMLVAMTLIDFTMEERKAKTARFFLLGLSPIIAWTSVVAIQNALGSMQENLFIQEIIERRNEIPNTDAISLGPLFQFLPTDSKLMRLVQMVFYPFVFVGTLAFFIRRNKLMAIISIYILLYLITHILYPAFEQRYAFPILWAMYFLTLWPLHLLSRTRKRYKYIVILLALLTATFTGFAVVKNSSTISEYLLSRKDYLIEKKLIGIWLSETEFRNPNLVISFESWITRYYTNNPRVTFHDESLQVLSRCDSVLCLIKNQKYNSQRVNILFIRDSNAQEATGYRAEHNGARFYQDFENSKDAKYFTPVTVLQSGDKWVEIYQYQPPISS